MSDRWLIWSERRDPQARPAINGWKLRAHDASGMTAEAQKQYGIEVMPVSEYQEIAIQVERIRDMLQRGIYDPHRIAVVLGVDEREEGDGDEGLRAE